MSDCFIYLLLDIASEKPPDSFHFHTVQVEVVDVSGSTCCSIVLSVCFGLEIFVYINHILTKLCWF